MSQAHLSPPIAPGAGVPRPVGLHRLDWLLRPGPLRRFAALAAVLSMGVGAAPLMLVPQAGGMGALAALAGFAAITLVAGTGLARHYPHARLGLCNAVTLTRAALVATLIAAILPPLLPGGDPQLAWGVLGIAALALALDGVDGYAARRAGLASAFGARFDMEVDALLAAVLAVLVWQGDKAGLWVVALGGMRYAFLTAGLVLPWLRAPLPARFSRKAVCVAQIGALIVLIAPPVVPPLSVGIAVVATGLLVWSFAVDVIWLARRHG